MENSSTPDVVVKAYWDAEEHRDIEAVLGHYHADAELVVPELGRLTGHDQIRSFYAASVARFPKLRVAIDSELTDGDRGVFEWSSVFTDHAGQEWKSNGVNVIRVSGGKFASVHVYYDPAPLAPPGAAVTDVLVVGSYNAGLTVYGPRLPTPGETVVADRFDAGPGGKGANQAIGVKRLGADVAFVTKLGDDSFGREARATLLAEGLPGWGILPGQAPTGVAFILVDAAAENMIAIAPGANLELTAGDVLELESGLGAGIVLVQLECTVALATGVAAWARDHGKRAILNPAPARDLTIAELALFDIITPNETELRSLAAGAGLSDGLVPGGAGLGPGREAGLAAALVEAGVRNVVVTLGEKGALWVSAEGARSFPAYPVRAVDTTGAGDAFNAGLAAALARGESLETAIDQGCQAGAFCVTRRGVIDGLGYPGDLAGLARPAGSARPAGPAG